MSRPNPLILIGIIAVLGCALSWLNLTAGGFFVSSHEGDTIHLLDIIFRMNSGYWPHIDFVTPLGILGFIPFVMLMGQGYAVGDAILIGQTLAAAILAPLIFYVAWTRLSALAAYAFAGMMVILVLAMSFGGTGPGLSMSMHYNRWSWVVASLLVLIALLPSRTRPAPEFEGVLLAFLFSILVLTKVTFFIALLPGVVVTLLVQSRVRVVMVGLIAGVVFALILLFLLGPSFWLAYAADLLNVSRSDVRPHTGLALTDIIGSPAFLPVTIVGFASFLMMHRAGFRGQALGLVLLLPGFIFITWQNFGNDPKWLIPLAALLLTVSKWEPVEGMPDYSGAFRVLSAVAAILFLPSAITMAASPMKHAAQDRADYEPMLPPTPLTAGIYVRLDRGFSMMAQQFEDDPGDNWARFSFALDREPPTEINGIPFPQCEFLAGSTAWLRTIGEDLIALGVEPGSALFTTDVLASFWFYEPFSPLQGGAPWYYGDLSGIENADYVVVPKCGFAERVRQIIISDIANSGLDFETFADTERVAVFVVR